VEFGNNISVNRKISCVYLRDQN